MHMLSNSDSENMVRFLEELGNQTREQDISRFSMYTIGETIGLDREAAGRTAEELMGQGWVEIRTLAGDIGITDEGLAQLARTAPAKGDGVVPLGDRPVLDEGQIPFLEDMVAELKVAVACMELDIAVSAEVMADLRTMDAQMVSPRVKTAILRAALESIGQCLAGKLDRQLQAHLQGLIA